MSDLTSDEDEEGVKKSEASISTLASWCVLILYVLGTGESADGNYMFTVHSSCRYAKKYSTAAKPPLVVIIQQFEAMAAPAMQDLILLLSRHPSLPVVFVFGVATSLATMHTSLAQVCQYQNHLLFISSFLRLPRRT